MTCIRSLPWTPHHPHRFTTLGWWLHAIGLLPRPDGATSRTQSVCRRQWRILTCCTGREAERRRGAAAQATAPGGGRGRASRSAPHAAGGSGGRGPFGRRGFGPHRGARGPKRPSRDPDGLAERGWANATASLAPHARRRGGARPRPDQGQRRAAVREGISDETGRPPCRSSSASRRTSAMTPPHPHRVAGSRHSRSEPEPATHPTSGIQSGRFASF